MPTFFVTNLPDLDASCIHKILHVDVLRFAQSSAVEQTHSLLRRPDVEVQPARHISTSFAKLWTPRPSGAALTAAYSSLSAEDNDTTCRFLVHVLRQYPPLMMTPENTDRRVALSLTPSQRLGTSPASPLCCQRNQLLALCFPARFRPILLDTVHVPQCWLGHCAAHLHRSELEIWSVLRQVSDSCDECTVPRNVTARECLAVTGIIVCHLRLVSAVTLIHVVPLLLGLCPSPSPSILPLAFIIPST